MADESRFDTFVGRDAEIVGLNGAIADAVAAPAGWFLSKGRQGSAKPVWQSKLRSRRAMRVCWSSGVSATMARPRRLTGLG